MYSMKTMIGYCMLVAIMGVAGAEEKSADYYYSRTEYYINDFFGIEDCPYNSNEFIDQLRNVTKDCESLEDIVAYLRKIIVSKGGRVGHVFEIDDFGYKLEYKENDDRYRFVVPGNVFDNRVCFECISPVFDDERVYLFMIKFYKRDSGIEIVCSLGNTFGPVYRERQQREAAKIEGWCD